MPVMRVLLRAGMEEMELQTSQNLALRLGKKTQEAKSVKEAHEILAAGGADKLVDMERVQRDACERAEQSGIIFIDEIDKIAGREGGHGPDVSREGVQRDILPIVEGTHRDHQVRPGEDRSHALHRRRRFPHVASRGT